MAVDSASADRPAAACRGSQDVIRRRRRPWGRSSPRSAAVPGLSGQVINGDGSLHKFVNVYVNDDDVRYLSVLDTTGHRFGRGVHPPRRRRGSHRTAGTHAAVTTYGSVLDLIGNTPLVDITALSPNPDVRILVKLEGQNPGGSVKDRSPCR